MIILGLTGSIGMGKSTLAVMLRNLRIPVHESDNAVHELLGPESTAYDTIAASFPTACEVKTRTINRQILGALVFTENEKRLHLESILHPLVQNAQQKFVKNCSQRKYRFICLDIPLLFETGAQNRVDYTLVVTAPHFVQRARVFARPNMTEEKFNAILAHQMPDSEKCANADYIIHTGLGLAHTLKSLKLILTDIEKKQFPLAIDKKANINDPRNRPRY